MHDYAKSKVKSLGVSGPGKNRVNQAGCHTYVDQTDVDEIIEEHLRHGPVVERLKM